MDDSTRKSLKNDFSDLEGALNENVNLSRLSTIGIGGTADFVVSPKTGDELVRIISACNSNDISYCTRGNGSNTIYGNVPVLVNTSALSGISNPEEELDECFIFDQGLHVQISVLAGTNMRSLVQNLASYGFQGAEPYVGVPGTIGGLAVMNAGVKDQNICSIVDSVRTVDKEGKVHILGNSEIYGLGDRRSSLQTTYKNHIVTEVVLNLIKGNSGAIKEEIDAELKRRESSLYPSVGSVWRRRGYKTNATHNPIRPIEDIMPARLLGRENGNFNLYIPEDESKASYIVSDRANSLFPPSVGEFLAYACYIQRCVSNRRPEVLLKFEVKFEGFIDKACSQPLFRVMKNELYNTYKNPEHRINPELERNLIDLGRYR